MTAALLLCLTALAASPADEVRAAAADAEQMPAIERATTRYLTLYAVEPAERQQAIQVVGYTLNALSRTRAISLPTLVSPTLLRFNIAQFTAHDDELHQWFAAWENLAAADPYFHLRTEVLAQKPADKAIRAATASTTSPLAPRPSPLAVTTDGGWVDLAAAARLRAATQSTGAILRADYFIAQATTTPAYYDFAGVPKTENEFLKSLGLDRETIDRLRADAGANLIISGVTGKPRRIVWSQGPLGGVYSTLDVECLEAERDPLRRPISADGFALKYDVSEWFALAPNGLWRTALYDATGKRQDSVPDRVAKDTSDPAGDGIVVPMLSCIRCHREAGLRPFRDDQTRLLAGHVDLLSADPRIIQRAAEFYDEPRLQRQMQFDRQTYTDAVHRATSNLTPEALADALAGTVRRYAYLPLTANQAAAAVGLDAEQFRRAVIATHDPVVILLIEKRGMLRSQWESSFAEAALSAAAYKTTAAKSISENSP